MGFLPVSKKEISDKGWQYVDFVCVTGDAYADHPSFGIAIIARVLESRGFRVAVLAQPAFDHHADFKRFGRPRYAFFISGGNIDSMVAHYTAAKRRRSDDVYTPGNAAGRRPDRAVTVYSRLAKEAYPDCPVVIGGLEASLRRFAHYDYWDDRVRPSVLLESGADLLVYGMGEHQTAAIADRLRQGQTPAEIKDVSGTCYLSSWDRLPKRKITCASFAKVAADKKAYAQAFQVQSNEQDHCRGLALVQQQTKTLMLVQNPPSPPLEREELDRVYALPFQRGVHPLDRALGEVKAIEEVEFSLQHNRGCFGNCSFCAITMHQGRHVRSRSHQSVLAEAEALTRNPRFKGNIHDVGGPTANFRGPSCQKQLTEGMCRGKSCLAPTPCRHLQVDHDDYTALLRKLRKVPGVKRVFIRSGIRFDYVNLDKKQTFLNELIRYHVSGQLKIAPEHSAPAVLAKMCKPEIAAFTKFCDNFFQATKKEGKEQYVVPYFMSSHPGCTLADAVELALFLKKHHLRPEQVQDFYPTPGTLSTAMFYTGLDPRSMQPVYVPKSSREKRWQRALLQYYRPENRELVAEALLAAGRADLIGNRPNCLIPAGKTVYGVPQAGYNKKTAPKNKEKGREHHGSKKGQQRPTGPAKPR